MRRAWSSITVTIMIFSGGAVGKTPGAKITVSAQSNIYGAGQAMAPGGGSVPDLIPVPAGEACVTFRPVQGVQPCASPEGCISVNNGANLNDPDGVGGARGVTMNGGTSLISGIAAPHQGYLVGVFTPAGGPSGPAPPTLDFTTGAGTSFKSLSPLLDQTFFVGDDRRGDAQYGTQNFIIPAGAANLSLGVSDSCYGAGNPPGCYADNQGYYTVHYKFLTSCQGS